MLFEGPKQVCGEFSHSGIPCKGHLAAVGDLNRDLKAFTIRAIAGVYASAV
jgi:hypothetical protein